MIKLFASDMDGTLLNEKHVISKENAHAIKQLQAAGIEFIIATGRDYSMVRFLLDPHDIQCRVIGLNGATVYDVDGTLLEVHPIRPSIATEVICYLLRHELQFVFQTEHQFYVANREQYLQRLQSFLSKAPSEQEQDVTSAQLQSHMRITHDYASFSSTQQEPILKFMIFSNDASTLETVRCTFEQYPELDVTSSGADNLEVTSVRAQKGLALEHYAINQGITMEDIACIGDSLNDRSMLRMARYSFAMDNAPQSIKDMARYLAPSNHEHGVAHTIQKILSGEIIS